MPQNRGQSVPIDPADLKQARFFAIVDRGRCEVCATMGRIRQCLGPWPLGSGDNREALVPLGGTRVIAHPETTGHLRSTC
jgi:hypothetical protein